MRNNLKISVLIVFVCQICTLQAQTKKTTTKSGSTNTKKVVSTVKPASTVFQLKSRQDSVSYALGIDIGKSLKKQGFEINDAVFQHALKSVAIGEDAILKEDEIQDVLKAESKRLYEVKSAELIKPGKDFLENNLTNPAVKVTEEGVQYEILKKSEGAKPTPENVVVVHYKGSLIDGKQFDSSYDRGEPIELSLNRVIKGWQIGIPLMGVGAKYRFYVPYDLAYGDRDMGEIPPFSTLIFEVELLEIK